MVALEPSVARRETRASPIDGVSYAGLVAGGKLFQQLVLPVKLEQGHVADLQLLGQVCFLVSPASRRLRSQCCGGRGRV